MTLKIAAYLLLCLLKTPIYGSDIFDKISNKTWFQDHGFAGTSIVFYKTENGLFKCIRQINGSGVPVVNSEIYDVEIQDDTIRLIKGLNLKTAEELENRIFIYNIDKQIIFDKTNPLKVIFDKPILFSWTANILTKVNIGLLSKIPIHENQIYKENDVEKTLMDD